MRFETPTDGSTLTQAQLALLPTEADIVKYEQTGWYVTPKIVDDDMIDRALAGAFAFYDGKVDFELSNLSGIANDAPDEKAALLNNEFVTLQSAALRALGFSALVTATAARLARTSEIRLFADSLINKRPQKPDTPGVVGWHTDRAYWPTCTSDVMLTAWIPFQDVTRDMGPVAYVEGSHKWREDPALRQFYGFNNQDLSKMDAYLTQNAPDAHHEVIQIERGQVAFHNCHVIHCSHPNVSTKDRLALAVHFQDAANCNQKAVREDGSEIRIGYDSLCRSNAAGRPDYSDPDLFPVLYRD